MVNWLEIAQRYFFTDEDQRNLARARQALEPYSDEFAQSFYDYLANYPDMKALFPTKADVETREGTMANWFRELLSGQYGNHYIERLRHVGLTHVRREIPITWVTSSMTFKRGYISRILQAEIDDVDERERVIDSVNKLLDINLDVLTSSYHEEQIKKIFLTERLDSKVISFAERFSYGLNLVLVLALVGLSIGVAVLFAVELVQAVQTIPLKHDNVNLAGAIIAPLGTLLIVWVLVELMGTEIRYLRGERFKIEIFVAVALVSVIRELLITSLQHPVPVNTLGVLLGAVLVLGVVYWLIVKAGSRAAH